MRFPGTDEFTYGPNSWAKMDGRKRSFEVLFAIYCSSKLEVQHVLGVIVQVFKHPFFFLFFPDIFFRTVSCIGLEKESTFEDRAHGSFCCRFVEQE